MDLMMWSYEIFLLYNTHNSAPTYGAHILKIGVCIVCCILLTIRLAQYNHVSCFICYIYLTRLFMMLVGSTAWLHLGQLMFFSWMWLRVVCLCVCLNKLYLAPALISEVTPIPFFSPCLFSGIWFFSTKLLFQFIYK